MSTATGRVVVGSFHTDLYITDAAGGVARLNLIWLGDADVLPCADELLQEHGWRRSADWDQTIGDGVSYGAEWVTDIEPTAREN